MAASLIFDGYRWPAPLIDNQNVDPLGVDRVKCIVVRRAEDFPKAGLRENAIAPALCRYVVFDDLEDLLFRRAEQFSFFKGRRHHRVQLLPGICNVGGQRLLSPEWSSMIPEWSAVIPARP